MFFNPLDKLNEMMDILKEFDPKLRRKTDVGYESLETDTDLCIEILRPGFDDPSKGLLILCEGEGFFSMWLDWFMWAFFLEKEYEALCQTALDVLNNRICVVKLRCLADGAEVGGAAIRSDDLGRPLRELCPDFWEYDAFLERITLGEFEVCYTFWDSSLNKTEIVSFRE